MANMQNYQGADTASAIGQAAQMKRYNDIPIDILPNDSFARLYAPGTKTLDYKKMDENTRQFDLSLQEDKRASMVREALQQKQFDADEKYRWTALNRSGGSGGGGGSSGGSIPKMSKTELKAQYKEWLDTLNNPYSTNDSQGRAMWQKHNDPASVGIGAIENEADWLREMGLGTADLEELRNYAAKNLRSAALQGYDLRAVKEPAQYDNFYGIPGMSK